MKRRHGRALTKRYGRAGGAARMVPRRALGEMMQHWHASASDPYYAVGSFYFANNPYPKRDVVEQALSQAESDSVKAAAGAHGWTKKDAAELRRIASGLRHYLKHDYAGG